MEGGKESDGLPFSNQDRDAPGSQVLTTTEFDCPRHAAGLTLVYTGILIRLA